MLYILFYTYVGCGQALALVKVTRLQDEVMAMRRTPSWAWWQGKCQLPCGCKEAKRISAGFWSKQKGVGIPVQKKRRPSSMSNDTLKSLCYLLCTRRCTPYGKALHVQCQWSVKQRENSLNHQHAGNSKNCWLWHMCKAYMPALPGMATDTKCQKCWWVGLGRCCTAGQKKKDIIPCAELKGNPDGFLIILRVRISDPSGQERGTTWDGVISQHLGDLLVHWVARL